MAPAEVKEGNDAETVLRFSVSLSRIPRLQTAVDFISTSRQVSSTSATGGVDYRSVSGRLTFEPGETNKFVDVPVFGDRAASIRMVIKRGKVVAWA